LLTQFNLKITRAEGAVGLGAGGGELEEICVKWSRLGLMVDG
jgi:hypothetical protein